MWVQKQKIVPTGYLGTQPRFGYSIAVNPSMTTLITGAYSDNNSAGSAFVLTFNGTTWNQESKLVGSNISGTIGSGQGFAVALSADADTAIVGGPFDGNYIGGSFF